MNVIKKFGADLYVGGNFTATSVGSVFMTRVARLGGDGNWVRVGEVRLNNAVRGIEMVGGVMFAVGDFTFSTAPLQQGLGWLLNSIWRPLSQAANGVLFALEKGDSILYVGGEASTAIGNASKYVFALDVYNASSLEADLQVDTFQATGMILTGPGQVAQLG